MPMSALETLKDSRIRAEEDRVQLFEQIALAQESFLEDLVNFLYPAIEETLTSSVEIEPLGWFIVHLHPVDAPWVSEGETDCSEVLERLDDFFGTYDSEDMYTVLCRLEGSAEDSSPPPDFYETPPDLYETRFRIAWSRESSGSFYFAVEEEHD